MIDLRNFVDVNITRIKPVNRLAYDTIVYINAQVSDGYYSAGASTTGTGTKENPWPFSYMTGDPPVTRFVNTFIANNGKSIHFTSALTFQNNIWTYGSDKTPLPIDEIIIVNPADSMVSSGSGIQQKIFVAGTDLTKSATGNLIICDNDCVQGAVCAYLANIDISIANSVKDAAFTAVKGFSTTGVQQYVATSYQESNGVTVVAYLAGDYRILGGDDGAKQSIVNQFMQIVLTEELTNQLLNLLTSKIRLDSNGIASVKAACSRVLNKFVTNGYISTEKAWNNSDLYIDNELVAAENTPLIDGYKIHVGPITEDNIANHQMPPVYILYGDQVGVRKIVVTGEVF